MRLGAPTGRLIGEGANHSGRTCEVVVGMTLNRHQAPPRRRDFYRATRNILWKDVRKIRKDGGMLQGLGYTCHALEFSQALPL